MMVYVQAKIACCLRVYIFTCKARNIRRMETKIKYKS